MATQTYLALGLMSGTSGDGVDAALVRTDGEDAFEFVAGTTSPYEASFRQRLLHAAQHDLPLIEMLRLERELTLTHVGAARALLQGAGVAPARVAVTGFHGHTLRHVSQARLTLQIGDASLLAELLGVPVAADFRRRDLAAGGEGAPLAPLFHGAVFREHAKPLLVLNLGGVSNVTWLGGGGEIFASDAGPGCGLIDAWAMETSGQPFDAEGRLAMAGAICREVVERALRHPFFARPLPKSADRFEFQPILTLIRDAGLSSEDGGATLCAVTVEAITRTCREFPAPVNCAWVSGGGANHPLIIQLLRERFSQVRNLGETGLRPDLLEAECFAWLAVRRLRGLATSMPTTTGCRRATCGGLLTS